LFKLSREQFGKDEGRAGEGGAVNVGREWKKPGREGLFRDEGGKRIIKINAP